MFVVRPPDFVGIMWKILKKIIDCGYGNLFALAEYFIVVLLCWMASSFGY